MWNLTFSKYTTDQKHQSKGKRQTPFVQKITLNPAGKLLNSYRCQMLRPMVVNVVSQLHRFSCALARKEFWPLLFEPLSQKLYNRGLNSATIMKIKQLERIRRSLKIKNYFAACPDFFHKVWGFTVPACELWY